MQKFSFLRGWEVFFSKKTTFFFVQNFSFCGAGWSFWVEKMAFFWDFLENVAADLVWGNPAGRSARSARGLTRDAKAVSEKPEGTSQCGYQSLSLFAADLLLPSLWKVKWVSEWSESEWSNFWVFKIFGTFICYRGCLNLNCYIGKKVQKNFLMGLKIWWSWGSRFFFQNPHR